LDKKLNFKSIQEQIKEEKEKKQTSNKKSEKLDEKLMSMMVPNENINEDDFDYFQYFGQKRIETESSWKELQEEDVEKFKNSRANLIIKEEGKNPGIYVAKEGKSEPPVKAKLPIKISVVKVKPNLKPSENTLSKPETKEKPKDAKEPEEDQLSDDYDVMGLLAVVKKN